MLLTLSMRNIALIEQLTLDFHEGFHAMTGETGAGKSIVVDAVDLVLGGRADRDLIRTGTDRAYVEAVFDVGGNDKVTALLQTQAIDIEGDTVTLSREISRSGRNLCRVCGITLPVAFLRELAELLMDVHGQHEHQFLMDPRRHMAFLDDFGGERHQALLAQVAQAYESFIANHRAYAKLVKENDAKDRRVAELQASLNELEKARLQEGEEEKLAEERDRYHHAEKITTALGAADALLSGGTEGGGAVAAVKEATSALENIASLSPAFDELYKTCRTLGYELEEAGFDVSKHMDAADFDPARADKVESRLDLIRRLEKKYGDTVADVLAKQSAMQDELDKWTGMTREIGETAAEHKRLLAAYRHSARELTEARKALGTAFSKRMMEQLSDLGMGKTVFEVAFAPKPEGKQLMPQITGDDALEFMLSPNPGEPLKPLSKIASGGELSRLMLAIKSLEAERVGVGTMVFDEIDTGISGRMAQVVGEKMAKIAKTRQVLCVTHLPQIAAMADHQLLVEKHEENGRTNTSVYMLDHAGRVSELARMIGGADEASESARSHAEIMLMEAEKRRKEL